MIFERKSDSVNFKRQYKEHHSQIFKFLNLRIPKSEKNV